MSELPGNPHAYEAEIIATPVTDSPTRSREYYVSEAQLHATLAAAHETRTATLFAYWNIMSGMEEEWEDTPFQHELDDMHRTIRTRLGRTPEVPA